MSVTFSRWGEAGHAPDADARVPAPRAQKCNRVAGPPRHRGALAMLGGETYTSYEGIAMKLKVVLEPSDDGGFTVYVPSLPGCMSEGATEAEALTNIREAIELFLEVVDDELVRQAGEVGERLGGDVGAGPGDGGAGDRVGAAGDLAAQHGDVVVAEDDAVGRAAQEGDAGVGLGVVADDVAEAHELVDVVAAQRVEDRREGGVVGVDVGDQPEAHGDTLILRAEGTAVGVTPRPLVRATSAGSGGRP